jgi:hypothetical protein
MSKQINKLIAVIEENNKILKEIRGLLFLQAYDNNYISQQDMKAFCINIAVDIFDDMMKNNREFRTKMENNFRNNGPI